MKSKIIIIMLILSAVCFTKSKDTYTIKDTYDWKFTERTIKSVELINRIFEVYGVSNKEETIELIWTMLKGEYIRGYHDANGENPRAYKIKGENND